jgi:gamma-glutamylcyclotransferase (GGCT)/AIG2-like uncharacterized protein YtfP
MSNQQHPLDAVFVYGTLKRGQCRQTAWPSNPISITRAWIRGTLYGRADYPALTRGENRVRGELWVFAIEQMQNVLAVLDAIEGTHGNSSEDLYHRRPVNVYCDDGSTLGHAYTYFYNRDPVAERFAIVPLSQGAQAWPD